MQNSSSGLHSCRAPAGEEVNGETLRSGAQFLIQPHFPGGKQERAVQFKLEK